MGNFGIRLGKVINVNYDANTIDVLLENGGGLVQHVHVASPLATTSSGRVELPVLKTISPLPDGQALGIVNLNGTGDNTGTNPNLWYLENTTGSNADLEDKTTCYSYAVLAMMDEASLRTSCVCLGFIYSYRNQMVFDPENVDSTNPDLTDVTKEAVKRMKGGLLHRTNSGVYTTTDLNGNFEWFHPNGTFFRIAETPTQDDDGTIHVDLTGANRKAVLSNGSKTNMAFDTSLPVGVDGTVNQSRQLYAHFEVVTAKGVVEIDIDKLTGNVTIQTPKNQEDAEQDSNQLTIVCGGDAILESVQGNVTIQSANQDISIVAANNISIQTDNAASQSIVLAPNADYDFLPLFTKLADKFNKHTHECPAGKSSGPSEQLEQSDDATTVTVAG